jgi:hypothetical protein
MPKKSNIETQDSKKPEVLLNSNNLWYVKQFKKEYLNFPTIPKIKEYFTDSKNDSSYLYGSYNRLTALVTFGYFLDIDIVNTICTTFKIKDLNDDSDAIYSFGYFEYEKSTQ